MKTILQIVFCFLLNFETGFSQIKDSIYIDNVGYTTYNWISQFCKGQMGQEFKKFYHIHRINPDFRNILIIENDSLFLKRITIINREKTIYSQEATFSKLFLECVNDTIIINEGNVIRKCKNHKIISEKERQIVIRSGIVVSNKEYENILYNDTLLSRKTEQDVLKNIISKINDDFDWNIGVREQKIYGFLDFEISINKQGKIKNIKPRYGEASWLEKRIFESITMLPKWELRFKNGELIEESFLIRLKLDFNTKKIIGIDVTYLDFCN